MTNREIVDIYLNNGLIKTCIDCQFAKIPDQGNKNDFFQDLIVILLTYDNAKMMDAHTNNHMNALITRIIINNIWSDTSRYYADYEKFKNKTRDFTPDDYNIPDKDS